jgi:hypothetical protein
MVVSADTKMSGGGKPSIRERWNMGRQFPPIPGGEAPPTAPGQLGSFDFSAWQGPYGAPLTNLQLDALGAFDQLMGADPFLQSQDIQGAISQALGGGLYGPSSAIGGGTGAIFNQFTGAYPDILAGPSFDQTAMYSKGTLKKRLRDSGKSLVVLALPQEVVLGRRNSSVPRVTLRRVFVLVNNNSHSKPLRMRRKEGYKLPALERRRDFRGQN